jgi:hypothetical protein
MPRTAAGGNYPRTAADRVAAPTGSARAPSGGPEWRSGEMATGVVAEPAVILAPASSLWPAPPMMFAAASSRRAREPLRGPPAPTHPGPSAAALRAFWVPVAAPNGRRIPSYSFCASVCLTASDVPKKSGGPTWSAPDVYFQRPRNGCGPRVWRAGVGARQALSL